MGGDPGGLTAVGASVVGPGHVRRGIGCQDRHGWCARDGRLYVAVADGLGSAKRSDEGAAVAVEAALSIADFPGDVVDLALEMAEAARRALEDFAAKESRPLREFACTFIAVVADVRGVGTAHVGDGAVVCSGRGGLHLVSAPGDTEYLDVVFPLTSDDWRAQLRLSFAPGMREVAVFTDGCQHAALDRRGRPHPAFFRPLFDYARSDERSDDEIAQLLSGPRMSEHSDDDKTLVLCVLS